MTPSTLQQSKITPAHLRRHALVYIRQSSTQQVRSHQESTERQYALVQRAVNNLHRQRRLAVRTQDALAAESEQRHFLARPPEHSPGHGGLIHGRHGRSLA